MKHLLFLGVVVLCACLGLSCVSAVDHNLTSDVNASSVNLTSDNANTTDIDNSTSDVNLTVDDVNTTDIVNATTDVNLTVDDVNTTDIVNATTDVNLTINQDQKNLNRVKERLKLCLDIINLGEILGVTIGAVVGAWSGGLIGAIVGGLIGACVGALCGLIIVHAIILFNIITHS